MKALLAMAVAVGLVLGVSPASAQTSPRTFVESLDMSSPEAAGRLFIDAFERQDHVTMFFLLSPKAKQDFQFRIHEYGERHLFITGPGQSLMVMNLHDNAAELVDISTDSALMFDAYLLAARRLARLPFDLSGAQLDTKSAGEGGNIIFATSGAVPASLKIELMLMPKGQWRVERLTWNGSSTLAQPWGLVLPE